MAIHDSVEPALGEPRVRKQYGDAFRETELPVELNRARVSRISIVGCMTEFSVGATLSRALLLGHRVALVADAHSTFDNAFRPATGEIALLNEEVESASRRGLPLQLVTTEELPAWLADDFPPGVERQASRSGESAGGDAG